MNDPLDPLNKNISGVEGVAPPAAPLEPVANVLGEFLNNSAARRELAVKRLRNKELNPIEDEVRNAPLGELILKYGAETALQRNDTQEDFTEVSKVNRAERNAGQILGDTVLGAGQGTIGLLGAIDTVALSAAGRAVDLIAPERGKSRGGDIFRAWSAATANDTGEWGAWLASKKSTQLQDRQSLTAAERVIDNRKNLEKYNTDIEAGDNKFIAGFRRVGSDALAAGGRLAADPAIAGDIVAQALGSLGPSSKVASVGEKLTQKVVAGIGSKNFQKLGIDLLDPKTIARIEKLGLAGGIGLSEASGVYGDVLEGVAGLTEEQLLEGPSNYSNYIAEGITPQVARLRVADEVALASFVKQVPIAASLGLFVGKFEASPVSSFKGLSGAGKVRNVALQTGEEGLQGSSANLIGNLELNTKVSSDVSVIEGTGEEITQGLVGGFGISTATGAPSLARSAIAGTVKGTAKTAVGGAKLVGKAATSDVSKAVGKAAIKVSVPVVKGTVKTAIKGAELTARASIPVAKAAVKVAVPVAKVAGKVAIPVAKTAIKGVVPVARIVGKVAVPVVKGTGSVIGKTLDAVSSKSETVLDADVAIPAITRTAATVTGIAVPLLSRVDTTANRGNKKLRKSRSVETQGVIAAFNAEINKTIENLSPTIRDNPNATIDLSNELEPSTFAIASSPRTTAVSSGFTSSVPAGTTLIQTAANVIDALGSKTTDIKKLSDQDLLFASEVLTSLRKNASNLKNKSLRKGVGRVLASPEIKRLNKQIARIDLTKTHTAQTEVNTETVAEAVAVAAVNPANVSAPFVDKLLKQSKGNNLSPEDVKTLEVASKVASAVNNHVAQQIQISTDNRIALEKSGVDSKSLPKELAIDAVSRSVQIRGFRDKRGKLLRSVSDFAADILQGAQNPDDNTFINSDNNPEDAKVVADQFEKFATHLSNKVGAFNKSYDSSVAGNTQAFGFTSLVGGTTLVEAGQPGSAKPVTFHAGNANSTKLANTVHNDAVSAATVFNLLSNAYPELFSGNKITVPALRGEVVTNPDGEAVLSKEEEEASPFVSQENVTTVVNDTAQTEAIEKTNPELSPITQAQSDIILPVLSDILTQLGLPLDTISSVSLLSDTFSKANGDTTGRAYFGDNPGIAFVANVFKNITDKRSTHVIAHGLSHILDLKAGTDGVLGSTQSPDLFDQGTILEEVQALAKADPAYGRYFQYALGQNSDQIRASEVFAEIGAMFIMNPEAAQKLLPLGTAYVEATIESSKVSQTTEEGNSTPVPSTDTVPSVEKTEVSLEAPTELFANTYTAREAQEGAVEFTTFEDVLSIIEEQGDVAAEYLNFARPLINTLMEGANARLASEPVTKGQNGTVIDGILNGDDVSRFRRLKNTALVDPVTGQYDARLLGLAAATVTDWMSSAIAPDPSRIGEALVKLGIDLKSISPEKYQEFVGGVFARNVSENIAQDVLKVWGVEANGTSPMIDGRGIVEGLVKELLTVASTDTNFLSKTKVKVTSNRVQNTQQLINVTNLRDAQTKIGLAQQNSFKAAIKQERINTPSFGSKITFVPTTQERGTVELSQLERDSVKAIQDTPYTVDAAKASVIRELGIDVLSDLLGRKDTGTFFGNDILLNSTNGKNTSIERNILDTFLVLDGVEAAETTGTTDAGVQVFYPVGISKVGRHQMKGINPQNNKVLRHVVTATKATLDMTTQAAQDSFWLTVAQSSELNKVENEDHAKVLKNVQELFNAKFGEAVTEIEKFLETGGLNPAILKSGVKSNEPLAIEQLDAIISVAELNIAKRNGTEAAFTTSLAFEIDGKTDGPGNLMANFGQGSLSPQQFENFRRVGFFIGENNQTLNSYFSGGNTRNVDLYEITAQNAMRDLNRLIGMSTQTESVLLKAQVRFAAVFGDFKQDNETGQLQMTRNTIKSPMTQIVYKAGLQSVSADIADSMIKGFYEAIADLLDNVNIGNYFADIGQNSEFMYPELADDLKVLFKFNLEDGINSSQFTFNNQKIKAFETTIRNGIGTAIFDSVINTIGTDVTRVSDTLVLASQVQSVFAERLFDQKLNDLLIKKGKLDPKTGEIKKFPVTQLTQNEYDALVDEVRIFNPEYSNGNQTLSPGSFSNQAKHNIILSSDMNEDLNQKSSVLRPDKVGVKVVPSITQGRGDAMMINRFFGNENAPTDAVPYFDGIGVPADKAVEYAGRANEIVLDNWKQDTLGDVVDDFDSFLTHALSQNPDLLTEVFGELMAKAKKKLYRMYDASELLEDIKTQRNMNLARTNVFSEIASSIDHMGGSSTSFASNPDQEDISHIEINRRIDAEFLRLESLENNTKIPETTHHTELKFTPAIDALKALSETGTAETKASAKSLLNKVPEDVVVVTGSLDQLNKHREDTYPTNSQHITDGGVYDTENRIVYIADISAETLLHELVHVATFDQIFSHYEGDANPTVQRLENLMTEFLGLDFAGTEDAQTRKSASDARVEILKRQALNDTFSQAAALNEFMAWTLSNEALAKKLKTTRSTALQTLSKKLKALMRRLFGSVSSDIFTNVVFNTQLLKATPTAFGSDKPPVPPTDLGDGDGSGDNSDGELTPFAHNQTNYWLDLLGKKIAQTQELSVGRLDKAKQLNDYTDTAIGVLQQLTRAGFGLNDYQRRTFLAIHTVLATELQLDTQSALALGRVFTHVTKTLKPEMFSGSNAEDKFSTVMDLFGSTENVEGVSDALAVLLALSQTSESFRQTLDRLPLPETNKLNYESLNDLLSTASSSLMRKFVNEIDTTNPNTVGIIDALSEKLVIIKQDESHRGLRTVLATLNKADVTVSAKFSEIAEKAAQLSIDIDATDRSVATKLAAKSVALGTSLLSNVRTAGLFEAAKSLSHAGTALDGLVPIQEFVANLVGKDSNNSSLLGLLDKTNKDVTSARQAYKEEVPVFLQEAFTETPTAAQWKQLSSLANVDYSAVYDVAKPRDSLRLIQQPKFLNSETAKLKASIVKTLPKAEADAVLEKSQQLADFLNGNGPGLNLLRNAYKINEGLVESDNDVTSDVDKYVSLLAIQGLPTETIQSISDLIDSDQDAVLNLVKYTQALNIEEDTKIVSEAARLNGYKGYIPNNGKPDLELTIEEDVNEEILLAAGYTRVSDYTVDGDNSTVSRGVYTTATRQEGTYTQGVLQTVQDSYRGVDATTGLTVNRTTSGVISGSFVDTIRQEINGLSEATDNKEALLPVFDEDGLLYYERAINPDLIEKYLQPDGNYALQLGVWAGRQVEEKFAQQYNDELIDVLHTTYTNRLKANIPDNEFVNIADPDLKDPIYKDSWRVVPAQTKAAIAAKFGEGEFWVKKDQINTAVGYREASIADVWTGKTRMPKVVTDISKIAFTLVAGTKAATILSNLEKGLQSTVSLAKDTIVTRSLIVPYMNTQSNVFQLNTRGVGSKDLRDGYSNKFSEIEQYNNNTRKVIRLQARQRFATQDANAVRVLSSQIKAIGDENSRMSIAPLIEAGAYKNISEGMTELDVELTSGTVGKYIENLTNKLPSGIRTGAKYALVSQDTQLYKMADKFVQYGDFLAKSIYYDHLVNRKNVSPEEAIGLVSEEFVNFSAPIGRFQSGLESYGLLWFLTFKIRITKTAFSILRNNPVRALITATTVGPFGSPVEDNLVNVAREDRLDYAVGWEMLMGAPGLNPAVNLANIGE